MKMTADELRQNGHWLQTVAKGIGGAVPRRIVSAPPAPLSRRHTLVHYRGRFEKEKAFII
jgi:hypothetical protein